MTKTSVTITVTHEVEALAGRPYAVLVSHDNEDGYIGRIPELPGLLAVGDTLDEMYALVEDAKRAWIATAVALGRPVPPPRPVVDTPAKSGKFVVRIAPSLHAMLAQEAERHGMSLNEMVSTVFSLTVAAGFDDLVEAVAHREDAHTWRKVKLADPQFAGSLEIALARPLDDGFVGPAIHVHRHGEGKGARVVGRSA